MANNGRPKTPRGRNIVNVSLSNLAFKNWRERLAKGRRSRAVSDWLETLGGSEDVES